MYNLNVYTALFFQFNLYSALEYTPPKIRPIILIVTIFYEHIFKHKKSDESSSLFQIL